MNAERELRRFLLGPACTLKPHLRLLAVALASLADWHTGRGQASQAAIAAACGLSDRQVRASLAELMRLSGTEGAPLFSIWTRNDSTTGDRLPNGYFIRLAEAHPRKSTSGGVEAHFLGGGSPLPGSLSTTHSGAGVPYGTPPLPPVVNSEVVVTTSPFSEPGTRRVAVGAAGPGEKVKRIKRAGGAARRAARQPATRVQAWAPDPTGAQLQFATSSGLDAEAQLRAFRAWHAPEDQQREPAQWAALFGGWLRKASAFRARDEQARALSHERDANARDTLAALMNRPAADLRAIEIQSEARRDKRVRRAAARLLHCSQADLSWSDSQLEALDSALSATESVKK